MTKEGEPVTTIESEAEQLQPAVQEKKREKSFRELFTVEEIAHYSIAALIYIALGVWLKDVVLNWVVGPLYIIAWMWIVPPIVKRVRGR